MNAMRIINLLRGFFIEHKKMLLICSLIVFAAAILDATFSYELELSVITLFIPFWIAGIFFQPLLKQNNSTFLFNLPVTARERLVNAVVVTTILVIITHLLFYVGANTGHYGLRLLLNPEAENLYARGFSIFDFDWHYYVFYFAVLFAFLFGSIYFKKNAFWKTLLCGTGFSLGVLFYNLALLFIVFKSTNMSVAPQYTFVNPMNLNILNSSFWQGYFDIIPIALILFFILLTYLRLKETEV